MNPKSGMSRAFAQSMIQGMHGETLVGTLLNTLEAERYARGPVLLAIVDELCADGGLEAAADSALAILEELEAGKLSEGSSHHVFAGFDRWFKRSPRGPERRSASPAHEDSSVSHRMSTSLRRTRGGA